MYSSRRSSLESKILHMLVSMSCLSYGGAAVYFFEKKTTDFRKVEKSPFEQDTQRLRVTLSCFDYLFGEGSLFCL
jgi:hypothetical protein